jgi:signal transduction histidine kinase
MEAQEKLKETNGLLLEAVQKAELATQLKSEFLAMISHEIRTPLHGIAGMLDTLRETALDTTQLEYINVISQCSENLMRLVSDILDVSKIEAGVMEMESNQFQLQSVLEPLLCSYSQQCKKKGLKFIVEGDYKLMPPLTGDFQKLQRVIKNLLNNAVKFTNQGSICIKFQHQLSDDANDNLCNFKCSVSDTGIGISSDSLEKLFKPFSQVDSRLRFGEFIFLNFG